MLVRSETEAMLRAAGRVPAPVVQRRRLPGLAGHMCSSRSNACPRGRLVGAQTSLSVFGLDRHERNQRGPSSRRALAALASGRDRLGLLPRRARRWSAGSVDHSKCPSWTSRVLMGTRADGNEKLHQNARNWWAAAARVPA